MGIRGLSEEDRRLVMDYSSLSLSKREIITKISTWDVCENILNKCW